MKKFRFLLLDAGPIIKLFEVGIWDAFVEKCDVTVARTVASQVKWASQELQDICIDFEAYEREGRIKIIDVEPKQAKLFIDEHNLTSKYEIHSGEMESLAFLFKSSEEWKLCASDGVVFRVLGFMGKANQGISLEEVLRKAGLSKGFLEWEYTKKFRERRTRMGEVDSVQSRPLM